MFEKFTLIARDAFNHPAKRLIFNQMRSCKKAQEFHHTFIAASELLQTIAGTPNPFEISAKNR
jgi:hypothetical protein